MPKYINILSFFCPVLILLPNAALPSACQKGQYFKEGKCYPCPVNTYMKETNHHFTSCFSCAKLSEDSHATVLWPCTSDSPTIFRCQEGYYRNSKQLTSEENCSPCDTCPGQYVGDQCHDFRDTVCCPEPNMEVEYSDQGPRCYRPSDSGNSGGKNERSEL